MSRNVTIGLYAVIALVTAFLTTQRLVDGRWARALISGTIFAFSVWRLYQLLTESSDAR